MKSFLTKEDVDKAWAMDLSVYPERPWLKEVSIIAIAWYRHGQKVDLLKPGWYKKIHIKIYWLIFHFIEVLIGVSIPKSACIGGGLRIYHFGNIFLHKSTIVGEYCTFRQGVTIGNRHNTDDVPVLGNSVELGAYAQLLGKIKLGNNIKVGAMSVVLMDVPDNKTVCGVPAKIIG